MLMGEYDFTDNFVETNTFWLSKVIFVIFVLDMSIVLMNLVIGLAVNDVDSIKRESNVQRLMNEAYTVMYLQQVLIILELSIMFKIINRFMTVSNYPLPI
jgi:hypothetical protein